MSIAARNYSRVEVMAMLGRVYGFEIIEAAQDKKLKSVGRGGPVALCKGRHKSARTGLLEQIMHKEGGTVKNTLEDLNDHLFAQLERLSGEDLKGDALKEEIARAGAVSSIARDIVAGASLAVKAEKIKMDGDIKDMPKMIRAASNDG
jgi:hypothetical protein